MSDALLLIVSAPSGAGKTSLVGALLQRDLKLVVSVSHRPSGTCAWKRFRAHPARRRAWHRARRHWHGG
jgi:hypothetical protein